ncbi:hypothetical protein MBLNU230_g4645t1 [Neophaeotheca triangularis]
MPPINPFPAFRTLAFRPRQSCLPRPSSNAVIGAKRPATQCRFYADEKTLNNHDELPTAEGKNAKGPNMQQQEHVSEEAAKMAQMTGGTGPDIEGQGTPVQEILQQDKDAQKTAPKVMKDSIKSGEGAQNAKPSTGSRSFSTFARQRMEMTPQEGPPGSIDPSMIPTSEQRSAYAADEASTDIQETTPGHKFPLPELPLPANLGKDYRYDPIVSQVTNLLMRDGKLAAAQRNMADVLNYLRTASPPTYSPTRPLLPGAPPASHLPLNPVLYLTLAIDSVAPLLRIRSQRGAAGGGVALQIPVPLGLRQRRRTAVQWILDAASKKKSRASGRGQFAQKFAEELVAVVEGRSGVWEKRGGVHRMGTTARSNLNFGKRR